MASSKYTEEQFIEAVRKWCKYYNILDMVKGKGK